MPVFNNEFSRELGPDITIISENRYFDVDENVSGLDILKMNREIASITDDGLVFSPIQEKEDPALSFFLNSQ